MEPGVTPTRETMTKLTEEKPDSKIKTVTKRTKRENPLLVYTFFILNQLQFHLLFCGPTLINIT